MVMSIAEETGAPSSLQRMISDLRRWSLGNLRYAADLILPPVCLHCHMPIVSHATLCADCWQNIDFITPPLCDRLGLPLTHSDGEITLSEAARRDPPLYRRARAVARFDGVMRNLIHGFKYADRHEASLMFAYMMRSNGAQLIQDADILMPVPLHPRKLWQRRYNQAAILANRLAAMTDLPLDLSGLRRIRKTPSQVGLSAEARRENVASAFAVKPGAEKNLRGKRVLLIDDVITTGSTLEGCTRALKKAGAANVDCLALAIADFGATS
jgi:ComF family protein